MIIMWYYHVTICLLLYWTDERWWICDWQMASRNKCDSAANIGSEAIKAHRLSLAGAADRYELSNGRNATSDTNCVRNPSIHSLTYIIATLDTNCVRNLSIHIVSHTLDGSCPWNFCMSSGKVAPPAARLSVVLKWVPWHGTWTG